MGKFQSFMTTNKEAEELLESFASAEGFDTDNINKYRVYIHDKKSARFDSSHDTEESAKTRAKELHDKDKDKEKAITILNPGVDKKEAKKFDKSATRFSKMMNK